MKYTKFPKTIFAVHIVFLLSDYKNHFSKQQHLLHKNDQNLGVKTTTIKTSNYNTRRINMWK